MNLKQALIENNSIRLGLEAADWKEAVKLAVEPLIESGAILPEYYDAIIESTEEYGPYYILMPGMAMPHARPEAGILFVIFLLLFSFPSPSLRGMDYFLILQSYPKLLLCSGILVSGQWNLPTQTRQ